MKETKLSPRLVNAINKEHNKSEIIISLSLLCFISLIGFLYFISPKGFHKEVPFEPVPIILLIFTPFVLIRVFLSLKHKMNSFLIYLSVIMDVSLIIILIWSFYIQYGQKPSFYLKVPTFTYLFVFLALRSLRFEIKYLVLTGISAVTGWLILLFYAIYKNGIITRDYIEYSLSDKILIGAEIDKIIVLIAVTSILAISIKKARQMLSNSEAQRLANEEMSKFFSKEIAEKIIYSENPIKPGDGVLREAVTFFIDLRGFTKLSNTISPHEVMGILAEYQSIALPIVLKHNGSIDKFMGDGILCHFGAAVVSETCVADALRCIEEMIVFFKKRNNEAKGFKLNIGIGCEFGKMIFGAIGDETRLEFTVIGETVNTSSKFEKHNKQLKTFCLISKKGYDVAVKQGFIPTLKWEKFNGEQIEGITKTLDLMGVIK